MINSHVLCAQHISLNISCKINNNQTAMKTISTTTVLGKRRKSHLILRLSSSPAPLEAATAAPSTETLNKKARHPCTYSECTKSYSKASRLAEHQRSHTGEVRIAVTPDCRSFIIFLYSVRLHVTHVASPTCERVIYRRTAGAICPNLRGLTCAQSLRNVINASGHLNISLSTETLTGNIDHILSAFEIRILYFVNLMEFA